MEEATMKLEDAQKEYKVTMDKISALKESNKAISDENNQNLIGLLLK